MTMVENSKRLDSTFQNRPVFIEVPKAVNQMSKAERDIFVEEILKAITEQYK